MLRCAGCGLLQTHPFPEDTAPYYASDAYHPHRPGSGLTARAYALVRSLRLASRCAIARGHAARNPGRVLDIGCGTGEFLAAMRRRGWKASGTEADPSARDRARSRTLEVTDGTLPVGPFDVVTFWHSLEHLADPVGVLRNARALLAPGGRCIVAVPNCAGHDAAFYAERWAAYDVPRHAVHFTPDTLERAAQAAGMRPVACVAQLLDPFYYALLSETGGHPSRSRALRVGARSALRGLGDPRRAGAFVAVLEPA